MKAALKLDLIGHPGTFQEVGVDDFITTGIWGLERDVKRKFGIAKSKLHEHPANLVEARHVRVSVSTPSLCHNLWQMRLRDVESFKRVFLDCLECKLLKFFSFLPSISPTFHTGHYHAYHTGRILHRDISENNLMIFRAECSAEAVGILNDFDMATERLPDAKETEVSAAHHRTGTLPFMALELVDNDEADPIHLYRHDLESFFYILIWAATHYDFGSQTKRNTPGMMRQWLDPDTAAEIKKKIIIGPYLKSAITPLVLAPFEGLWETWVVPLRSLFTNALHERTTYIWENTQLDDTTVNGKITFEKFMAAIGETPRGLYPNSQAALETST
jgi:serine/threonine protein kinase